MTDYEAWMELCDLYIREHDYTKAAFCLEELIMSNPHNHLYHQKYADVNTSIYLIKVECSVPFRQNVV